MEPLTVSAAQAATLLGWLRRDGTGNAEKVRTLYRQDRFPAPIDDTLPVRWWSWSRRAIERYADPTEGAA